MGLGKFVKENLVLLAGIALPVVMMIGFLVASSLPQTLANPPQYDLVFFTDDYSSNSNGNLATTVNLVVRDGTLVAQYVPAGENNYGYWKKIYRFEAATQTIREIPFGFPPDFSTLTAMREEPVRGLEGVKLDTRLQAPDGYELSSNEYRSNGLIGDLFWRSSTDRPRLRNGASSVPLELASDTQYYTYGNLQFLGWVVQ
jgi:hypothetical protein